VILVNVKTTTSWRIFSTPLNLKICPGKKEFGYVLR
jgi:hypothetical protein